MLPQDYTPTCPADFIGDARGVAAFLPKVVSASRKAGKSPIKLLFAGAAGTGKSELAKFLCAQLGVSRWSVTKLNGTQVKVERLDEITSALRLTDLFGDYRVVQIDEADAIPTVAQIRMLTVMDDLPPGTVVVCTSNASLKNFEARFQSRFQFFEFKPVPQAEIEQLLRDKWDLPVAVARQIAMPACGNVRLALLDAQGYLQQNEKLDLAA